MDDTGAAGAGPPAPPDEVQTTANEDATSRPTTPTGRPTGRPRRAADGSGLFQLLASVPGTNAPAVQPGSIPGIAPTAQPGSNPRIAPTAQPGPNPVLDPGGIAPTAPRTGPAVSNAWTRRPRLGLSLPTRRIKLPVTQDTQELFNNTVCITLVGSGWTQVRNIEVIKALQERGINVSRIEGAWKDHRHRHLQVTFDNEEEAMKTTALRTLQLDNDITATIRGRTRYTDIKVHFVPGWMATATVASFFEEYGEVIKAEPIYADHEEAKFKTGTVAVTLRADHHQAAAIPPRIEVEQHGVLTYLMVNVKGQPFLCWTCGGQDHPSSRCPEKFYQPTRNANDNGNNNDNGNKNDNDSDSDNDSDNDNGNDNGNDGETEDEDAEDDNNGPPEPTDTTPMDTDETVTLPITPTNANSTIDNTTEPDTPTEAILEAAVKEMTDKTQQNDGTGTDTDTGGVAATIAKTFGKGIALLKRRHSKTPETEDKINERSPSEEAAYEATQKLLEREKQAKKKKRQEEEDMERLRQQQEKEYQERKKQFEKEEQEEKTRRDNDERKRQEITDYYRQTDRWSPGTATKVMTANRQTLDSMYAALTNMKNLDARRQERKKQQEEKTRRDRDADKRKEITDYYRQTDRWSPETAKRVTTADTLLLDAIYAGLRDMKAADNLQMTKSYDPDTFLQPQTSPTERQRQTDRHGNQPSSPPWEEQVKEQQSTAWE